MKKKVGRLEENEKYMAISVFVNHGIASREYTIFKDKETGELTGNVIAHGRWYDIELDDINEVLGYFTEKELEGFK